MPLEYPLFDRTVHDPKKVEKEFSTIWEKGIKRKPNATILIQLPYRNVTKARLSAFNDRVTDLLGLPRTGDDFTDFEGSFLQSVHRTDLRNAYDFFRDLRETDEPLEGKIRLIRPGGKGIYVHVKGAALPSKRIPHLYRLTMTDITEWEIQYRMQKMIENASALDVSIQEAISLLKTTTNHDSGMLFLFSPEGNTNTLAYRFTDKISKKEILPPFRVLQRLSHEDQTSVLSQLIEGDFFILSQKTDWKTQQWAPLDATLNKDWISLMGVPLRFEGDDSLAGFVLLGKRNEGHFAPDDRQYVDMISPYLLTGFSNIQTK